MYLMSGAVAAYIDRKALDREGLTRLTGMLEALGIPRLSESEILSMGHLSWDTYRGVREMAGQILPGARCFIHNLQGEGTLCSVRIDPVLLGETIKSDEPKLIKNLGNLPVVHLSTQDNRLLAEFITYEHYSSELIHDLNTLCVKIIRNKEITATEKDHLIITRVRFDPTKAREQGVPPGPYYKHLSAGQAIEINGRVIQPEMVSSCSETRIYIPGLENYP
jgi:D-aminoacyl-tRNA deacylase